MDENQRYPKLISGVYFLYDGDEIVYVGQSANLLHRVGSHAGKRLEFDSWEYKEINDPIERTKFERAEIQRHKPKFNVLTRKVNWLHEARRQARLAAQQANLAIG